MLESGGWGGIHHYAHALANALADLGVELLLLSNQRYELEDRPCRFRLLRLLRREPYLRTLARLYRLLRGERPAVVHVQSFISQRKDLAVLLLCRWLGAKLVITVHNLLPHEVRPLERHLYALYYRLADALIVHSEQARRALLEGVPALAAREVHAVPHGNYAQFADLMLDRPAARQSLGLPPDRRVVLFVGAIRPYKGLDLFLRLARPVRRVCPEALFVAAGTVLRGSRTEYEEQVAALGLGPEDLVARFEYLSIAQTVAYVCSADVVVLPYRAISQSGILLLALSCGRPVLATRVGSFPETVEEGAGWLVEPEDLGAMEETLVRLLGEPALLEAAGERARKLAVERYGWDGIARRTAQVYAGVLGGGG
ncbi:MAG: glycosyltransferase family 4 protein [Candidatus Latescibacterota bacterium]